MWNVREVAQYLHMAPITIYRKVKTREIPFFRVGKRLKFSQEQIEEWLQKQTKGSQTSSLLSSLASDPQNVIQQMTEKIVSKLHPQKIILFGSYGWGTPTADSDIDLCIIHPTTLKRGKRVLMIRDVLSSFCYPLDILVYTPEEVEEWGSAEGGMLKKILDHGKVLYDETKH